MAITNNCAPGIGVRHRLRTLNPKAEVGAFAIALAAWLASQNALSPREFMQVLQDELPESQAREELLQLAERAANSAEKNESAAEFADA